MFPRCEEIYYVSDTVTHHQFHGAMRTICLSPVGRGMRERDIAGKFRLTGFSGGSSPLALPGPYGLGGRDGVGALARPP